MGATSILTGVTTAATIIPLVATAPSQLSGSRIATNMINGSNFNAIAGTVGTNSDNALWTSGFIASPSNDASSGNTAGSSPLTADYILTFDLGANYDLTQALVWNWNNTVNQSAGVKTMEILVASTVGGATTSLGNFGLTVGTGVDTFTGDQLSISASNVREVKFNILEGYGYGGAGANTLVALAEVRFDGTATPIPEPSSVALLGLGGLALLRRKRNN